MVFQQNLHYTEHRVGVTLQPIVRWRYWSSEGRSVRGVNLMRVSNGSPWRPWATSKRDRGLASISGQSTERSRPQIDADGLLAFQKAICDSGVYGIRYKLRVLSFLHQRKRVSRAKANS